MPSQRHPFHIALFGLCLVHLAWFAWQQVEPTLGIAGLLYRNGTPVGGDFINLWSAGRLVLEGRVEDIYRYEILMAYQVGLTGAPIGIRFWAYPPHSLLLAWPFGLVSFYPALALWSLLGLAVLGYGCRRLGLGALETAIVLLSPACLLCLFYGQTGNLATGLLLLALAPRMRREGGAATAAALLTMKPQMGLLLPLFWLVERRWRAIFLTTAVTLVLVGLAWLVFGPVVWSDYIGVTLPGLSQLEREGTGPFMLMIPSIFMALRILSGDGDLALMMHLALAVPIVLLAGWRLRSVPDPMRRTGVILAGTALLTPYLHNYDLTMVAVAALLVLRRFAPGQRGELVACAFVVLAMALPQMVVGLNLVGLPVSPFIILVLMLLI